MGDMPRPGEVYRHVKGHAYMVLGIAMLESPLINVVVYQSVNGGQVWVRPLSQWHDAQRDDVARFTRLPDDEAAALLARYPDAPRFTPFSPAAPPASPARP